MKQIYQQTPEEVLKHVNSSESGLTGEEVKKDKREGAAVGVANACRHALRFTLPAGIAQEGRNRRSAASRTRESLEQGFVKTSVFEEGRPGSALAGLGKGG